MPKILIGAVILFAALFFIFLAIRSSETPTTTTPVVGATGVTEGTGEGTGERTGGRTTEYTEPTFKPLNPEPSPVIQYGELPPTGGTRP